MTEYELHDLASGAMSNFLTTFTIFISIITAYVVAAFVAGKRLSRYQVAIVNVCFLIAAGTMGALSFSIFQNFLFRVGTAHALNASDPGPIVDFGWMVAALYVILIVACLVFMRHTRQKERE